MVHLIINGTKIDTTEKHPFWVIGKGWVNAGDLKAGNKVSLKTGEIGNVDSVTVEELDEPVKVYNFEVEDWHTYFVSNIGVLVHNKCWVDAENTVPKRPGGYVKNDVDSYRNLSPQVNRASGNRNIANDNRVQAHHPIQNEWAERNIPGYNKNDAPSILLESSSGKAHARISAAQRSRRRIEGYDTDIVYEFNTSYREMIDAGIDMKDARRAIRSAYKYFDDIGGFE